MKTVWYLLVVIVMALVGLTFVQKNPQLAQINYYGGIHFEAPLAVMLLLALAVGVVLGYLASVGRRFRLRRELSKSRKQVKKGEQEIANLRSLPLKD